MSGGWVVIDNNLAERALRTIGIGQKNFLLSGTYSGAEALARAMTAIESAKLKIRHLRARRACQTDDEEYENQTRKLSL